MYFLENVCLLTHSTRTYSLTYGGRTPPPQLSFWIAKLRKIKPGIFVKCFDEYKCNLCVLSKVPFIENCSLLDFAISENVKLEGGGVFKGQQV